MWKWLLVGVLLWLVVYPTSVFAFTTSEVTIEATGGNVTVCEAPTEFTATTVSLYEYDLSWTLASNSEQVLIRGAYGRFPANTTDGFEVFEGNATSTTLFIDTEFISVDIGLRAWTECTTGSTSTDFAQLLIRSGRGVGIIGLALLSLIPLILAGFGIHWQKAVFMIVGGFLWIGIAVLGLTERQASFDTFHIWSLMSLGMAIAWWTGPWWMGITEVGQALEDLETEGFDQWAEDMKKFEKDRGMRRKDEDEDE